MAETTSSAGDAGKNEQLHGCKELVNLVVACQDKNTDIIKIRDDSNKFAFFFFARELLPCVTKKLIFRQNKFLKRLSEFVTISDEAFALFTLENNAARWNDMFNKNSSKCDKSTPLQKFHNNNNCNDQQGQDNDDGGIDDGNKQNHLLTGGKDGYGFLAAERYNTYYKYIRDCRQDESRTFLLEQSLINVMDKLDGKDKKRLSGNKRLRNGELNYVDEEGKSLTVLCDL